MACSLKSRFCVSGLNEAVFPSREARVPGFCSFTGYSSSIGSNQKVLSSLTADFMGKLVISSDQKDIFGDRSASSLASFSLPASGYANQAMTMKWWEKGLGPNIVEINSAQELISSLLCANDSLVVVDFYSPGCGGCRALHPKVEEIELQTPLICIHQVCCVEEISFLDCLFLGVLFFGQVYFFKLSETHLIDSLWSDLPTSGIIPRCNFPQSELRKAWDDVPLPQHLRPPILPVLSGHGWPCVQFQLHKFYCELEPWNEPKGAYPLPSKTKFH
ncbi:hypothetical protein SAY86_021458 [Trapa natans]|uniref:Thioredoxin domain-containing protein n=1 Tax=Trapa natans TaxID=22666 RepID=A0AAN7RK54_TRANT|nr:hypothetical protein SAY86_021458 [Trapa natans]